MNKQILARTVVVLWAVIASMDAYGQDAQFPVSFRFHCGGQARNSVPKAMGFSPDSETLAIWYIRDLIFVDAETGKEMHRVRVAGEMTEQSTPYNYVAFDPSGKYCCIALVNPDGFTLQLIDVERRLGSKPAKHNAGRNWTLWRCFTSTQWSLPLRQSLAFQEVPKKEANFETTFSRADDGQQSHMHLRVSFDSNDRLAKAEQIFKAMDGEQAIKAARNVGEYAGTGMQVALSNDRKTLLAQFIGREDSNAWYRFDFYDVETKKSLTEIRLSTGIFWRHGVSRGFAFSPDFKKLVRSMPGGHVLVHNISSLVDRKLDTTAPVSISADYGTIGK